jgi:hypothetical protein
MKLVYILSTKTNLFLVVVPRRTMKDRKKRWTSWCTVRLAVEIGLHVCYQEADCQHRVAQAGFGAAESVTPVIDFVNGLDIDACGIGGRKGAHGEY